MNETGIIGIILIFCNALFSYQGFKNQAYFDKHKFEVDKILINKEYSRIISSGFLHVNWMHLIFNMVSLFAFSELLEVHLGVLWFLLVYFGSMIGGDLLALFVHRNHGDYSSVGASGAISGIIFASITLFPGMKIGLFGIDLSIPAWLYGGLYVLYSIYGIKSRRDNIAHEAHLGGALTGILLAIALEPHALKENYLTIALLTIPTLTFIVFIVVKPHLLLMDGFYTKHPKPYLTVDHQYNHEKSIQQKEIDYILEKIHRKGIDSLSKKEKVILEEYSKQ